MQALKKKEHELKRLLAKKVALRYRLCVSHTAQEKELEGNSDWSVLDLPDAPQVCHAYGPPVLTHY